MGSEGLKLVSKMALKKWNSNFRFQQSVRKNRTTFSGVPLLREIFRWNDPKSRVPFTFQPDFPETFGKLWTNPFFHANQCEKKYAYRKLFCQPTWLPCSSKTRVEGFALFVWLLTAYSDSCLSYGRAYEWFPFFKGPIIYISSHQSNSKNNAPVSLFKTILRHSTVSCRLSQRMARMDMEIGPTFWHFVWSKGTK